MVVSIEFDKDVLATALADVIEEEKQNPCNVHEKLRRYVKDGTDDNDVRWALDVMTEAASKAVETG
jgi:hypothetical protein